MNKTDSHGKTPFAHACHQGNVPVVQLLLTDERVDVNEPGHNGATPFSLACSQEHVEIMKLLLADERVDEHKADRNGHTPFAILCHKNKIETAKLFISLVAEAYLKKNSFLYREILTHQDDVNYLEELIAPFFKEYVLLENTPELNNIKTDINGGKPYGFFINCVKSYESTMAKEAAEYFSLMRLWAQDYLKISETGTPEEVEEQKNLRAFYTLFSKNKELPLELQMRIVLLKTGSMKLFIETPLIYASLRNNLLAFEEARKPPAGTDAPGINLADAANSSTPDWAAAPKPKASPNCS